MDEKAIVVEASGFKLEAGIWFPDARPAPGAILCHPHPQYGGDMDNNVVLAVWEKLVNADIAAFRFNFRGVGASQGNIAGPDEDIEDMARIVELFGNLEEIDRNRVSIIGYSYGAMIGLAAGKDHPGVTALVAISPPVSLFQMSFLAAIAKPLLVITGDRDAFCQLVAIRKMLPPHAKLEIIKDADHFYMGHSEEAGELATNFLKRYN